MIDLVELKPVVDLWIKQIEAAAKKKRTDFGDVADQCWSFYDVSKEAAEISSKLGGSQESALGLGAIDENPGTRFVVRLGKFAELVDLFGPNLYHRNPRRTIRARQFAVPDGVLPLLGNPQVPVPGMAEMILQGMEQAKMRSKAAASLMEDFLNYTPGEFGLKHESRVAIDESLIKGRGVSWHELYQPPGSQIVYPISTFRSVDDLLIDPDATSLRNAGWIALRCCESYYEVEKEYGWPEGSLREYARAGESYGQQASVDASGSGDWHRKQGSTNDQIVYYKVFSKVGLANHRAAPSISGIDAAAQTLRTVLDGFGDYTFLVIAPNLPHLINLPPHLFDLDVSQPSIMEFFKDHVRWPIPFWADGGDHFGGWPFSPLDLHPMPNTPWPRAHMAAALPEMQFINHCFGFLTGRMEWSCRTIIAVLESMSSELEEQIRTGGDQVIVKFKRSAGIKNINEAIQFIQQPDLKQEFWKILSSVMDQFDRRTGLIEAVYGTSSTQPRSATESQMKQAAVNVRPDDMAEKVEDWQSNVARKEAAMTRMKVNGQSIAAIYGSNFQAGNPAASVLPQIWDALVALPLDYTKPENIERVFREFDYTIESGSIRKPNREREQANMDQAMQVLLPMLQQYHAMSGDPTQLNALLTDWAKSRDLDPAPYLIPPPPPPPPVDPMTGPPMMPQQPQPAALPFPGPVAAA